MKYLLTCTAGLESIAKKEIQKLWYEITLVKDRLVYFTWDEKAISRVNINSRVWNKLYIVLEEWKIDDFDNIYDLIYSIPWKKYINNSNPILVKATSIRHKITATPIIQKVSKKAIVSKVLWNKDSILEENSNLPEIEILVFLYENNWQILLNTSWEALHKRWYRKDSWEAPIKETLAAWLVLLSNWSFKENLSDFCCWSWTILIEAWMIAKNIAPWINRKFAFQNFDWLDKNIYKDSIKEANDKIINDKKYYIFWSDIDEEILSKAKENAKSAWVDDIINFKQEDILNLENTKIYWTMISNPPYWIRLKSFDVSKIHKVLNNIFEKNDWLKWWIITAFEDFDKIIDYKKYKKRKLYNWNEKSYFYIRSKGM
jgi:putative N6-adenine-specific DNA methylase